MNLYNVLTAVLAFYALALGVTTLSHALLWCVLHRRPSGASSGESVTVLKPFCGADADAETNLQGFVGQSHRPLHLALGVASFADDALPMLRSFQRAHPDLAHVSIGERGGRINPKVALLEHLAEGAKSDWIAISDSNVQVDPDYIRDAVSDAGPEVGLVTHLVAGKGGAGLAAHCENLQLNAFIAPAVCAARFLAGRTCVIGKSIFLRRHVLEALGGLEAVSGYLAEDYALGQAVERLGYRVQTAATPVTSWHANWTFRQFFNRHTRWAVMRRRVTFTGYALELLLNPGPLALPLWCFGLAGGVWVLGPEWLLLASAWHVALVATTERTMAGAWPRPQVLVYNALREWLALALWIKGWHSRVIEWRGKAYYVSHGTVLQPVIAQIPERLADEA